jgi:hypothetical protein
MIRAVIFGQSHTVCMSQAAQANLERMEGISIYRFAGKRSTVGDGSVSIKKAIELIDKLPATVPVFLSIIGGIHNIMGLVRQEPDFDFLSAPDATIEDLDIIDIVPFRTIADAFDFYIEQASQYLPIIQAAQGPVFLIGTPPPKELNAFIIEKFSKKKNQDYRGRNVLEIGLNTPRLRRKFWELECQRSIKWAEKQGIKYLAAPRQSFDVNGFIKECYYEDATHANMDYGTLVLTQISEILKNHMEIMAHE